MFTKLFSRLSVATFGLFLLLLAIPGIFLNFRENLTPSLQVGVLLTNIYTNMTWELIGISITILIIDRLYQSQAERQEKGQLLRQLRSTDQAQTRDAVVRLRAQGWLADGTLCGAILSKAQLAAANLQQATLDRALLDEAVLCRAVLDQAKLQSASLEAADLQDSSLQNADMTACEVKKANLANANLRGAEISDEQLARAYRLAHAIMPNGKRYNGRFNLPGDLLDARQAGFHTDDPTAMARYYEVSLIAYQSGQKEL